MKILLDTHYLLWAFMDTAKISRHLRELLVSDANEIFYSQASLWEISIKYKLGKLVLHGINPEQFYKEVKTSHLECRRLENDELVSFHQLPIEHKDPFDRILIWQSIQSGYYFLSADKQIVNYRKYGLNILTP